MDTLKTRRILLLLALSVTAFAAADAPPPPCCGAATANSHRSAKQAWPAEAVIEKGHEEAAHSHLINLLDCNKNLFLLRGNMPEKQGAFDYSGLKSSIKSFLDGLKMPISDNFKIMDISFLNELLDRDKIAMETTWFKAHPETGCFWLHSLFGALEDPLSLTPAERIVKAKESDIDGLKPLMAALHKYVTEGCDKDFVVYIHCAAGKDRTGEASASYLMQYKKYSYKDAVSLDETIAKRKPHAWSMNAIRWYAFYLRDVLKMTTVKEIEGQ
jgi:hypothetical protein